MGQKYGSSRNSKEDLKSQSFPFFPPPHRGSRLRASERNDLHWKLHNPYSSIILIVCQGEKYVDSGTWDHREGDAIEKPTASVQHNVEFLLNLCWGDTHAPGCPQVSLYLELWCRLPHSTHRSTFLSFKTSDSWFSLGLPGFHSRNTELSNTKRPALHSLYNHT